MSYFNIGAIVFQLVVFIILAAILALIIIGVKTFVEKSKSNKHVEKQNEEILKQLTEIREKQEK